MKYIRLFSDTHVNVDINAFHQTRIHDPSKPVLTELDRLWYPDPLPTDKETCLVLAGDLWEENKAFVRRNNAEDSWLERLARQFEHVVVLLGNHDYWGLSLQRAPEKAREGIKELGLTNVHFLEIDKVVIDNVKFVGGTLWTNYKHGDPMAMMASERGMNDYRYITVGRSNERKKARPRDMINVFIRTKKFIDENAVRDTPDQKVIVVTHMAPQYGSIHSYYRTMSNALLNYSYYSDLDELMIRKENDIDLWMHGHTHTPSDYQVGKVRVLCNPRGYGAYEKTGFDPWMLIDAQTLEVKRTEGLQGIDPDVEVLKNFP